MTIARNWPTSATLAGARDINRVHLRLAQDDVGFKLERLISAVSILQSAVSAINVLHQAVSQINTSLGSAAASLAGASLFSAFSAAAGGTAGGYTSAQANITAWSSLSNFRVS